MNCRRAQSDIALWAGNDLDEAGLISLRRHLAACPACHQYLEQMQVLMHLVEECPLREEADAASMLAVEDSLWPSLSSRLVSLPARQFDHFNGWIPAVAVVAVCLLMVLVASPPQIQSPTEKPMISVNSDDAWPENNSVQEKSSPEPRHFLVREPIQGLPVDLRNGVIRYADEEPLNSLEGDASELGFPYSARP